jgi:hypothetical protein
MHRAPLVVPTAKPAQMFLARGRDFREFAAVPGMAKVSLNTFPETDQPLIDSVLAGETAGVGLEQGHERLHRRRLGLACRLTGEQLQGRHKTRDVSFNQSSSDAVNQQAAFPVVAENPSDAPRPATGGLEGMAGSARCEQYLAGTPVDHATVDQGSTAAAETRNHMGMYRLHSHHSVGWSENTVPDPDEPSILQLWETFVAQHPLATGGTDEVGFTQALEGWKHCQMDGIPV